MLFLSPRYVLRAPPVSNSTLFATKLLIILFFQLMRIAWGNYFDSLGGQMILEDNCWKYLEIVIRNDLSWYDQVNYTVQKA